MATVTFGLLSDIQYTDTEDHGKRRYRASLKSLREAITVWNNHGRMPFVIQLGDIVDSCTREKAETQAALRSVLNEFSNLNPGIGVAHVVGNHELYNFSKGELANTAISPKHFLAKNCFSCVSPKVIKPERFYCSFEVEQCRDIVFVILDTYNVSVLGKKSGSEEYQNALEILLRHNNNIDLDSREGLEGRARRYTAGNGGVGEKQLEWLEEVLAEADNNNQRAVIFSHIPLHPDSTIDDELVWNYNEVLTVLWRHRSVAACLSGHLHSFVYCQDEYGIHHRTIEALLEAPPGKNGYATVHVSRERMVIDGTGCVRSQVLNFSERD